jgi:hypothetical protein
MEINTGVHMDTSGAVSIVGVILSGLGLLLSIVIYKNSETIKKYIKSEGRRHSLKHSIAVPQSSVMIEIATILRHIKSEDAEDNSEKKWGSVRKSVNAVLGSISPYLMEFDKDAQKAYDELKKDIYSNQNDHLIIRYISIIKSGIEVIGNEKK